MVDYFLPFPGLLVGFQGQVGRAPGSVVRMLSDTSQFFNILQQVLSLDRLIIGAG